jgi:ketosteroid isomerase-like protein
MNPSLLLAVVAVAGIAHSDLRSELKASRAKIEKATKAKDAKAAEAAYEEFVTPDFKYVQDGSAQDFKTFVDNFTSGFAMMDKISTSSSRVISLKEHGNEATGEVEMHMLATMKGSDKKTQAINYTGIFTEQFRKVDGKWKMAVMTAGKQKFLVDGKPAKM